VAVQIRDLDQTVIGNPAHDLIRLGLSLASAARSSDLPGVTTARILEEMTAGYESVLAEDWRGQNDRSHRPETIQLLLRQSIRRRWRHLAEERLEDVKPTIPLGQHFWGLTKKERKELALLVESPAVREALTKLNGREDGDRVELIDAAYWQKGCSSLGRLRYAILLRIGSKNGKLCLLDIKESAAAAAPRARGVKMPANNAARIVAGARALSPNLGERRLCGSLFGKPVVIRELMPQDLKVDIDRLTREEAVTVARYLAKVVARAHGRQMDSETRKGWLSVLNKTRRSAIDAPTWLWSSVVELISAHEVAYLDHCRRYALSSEVADRAA
jgi:uncharacterized protein (DUF2252 family)